MRKLLTTCEFDWQMADDGVTAEDAREYIAENIKCALADRDSHQRVAIAALARAEAAEAREQVMREALKPSGATKADYIGEFHFNIDDWDGTRRVTVPWTTIKEIMDAINARAARALETDK